LGVAISLGLHYELKLLSVFLTQLGWKVVVEGFICDYKLRGVVVAHKHFFLVALDVLIEKDKKAPCRKLHGLAPTQVAV
jgi:hypothetical protein